MAPINVNFLNHGVMGFQRTNTDRQSHYPDLVADSLAAGHLEWMTGVLHPGSTIGNSGGTNTDVKLLTY